MISQGVRPLNTLFGINEDLFSFYRTFFRESFSVELFNRFLMFRNCKESNSFSNPLIVFDPGELTLKEIIDRMWVMFHISIDFENHYTAEKVFGNDEVVKWPQFCLIEPTDKPSTIFRMCDAILDPRVFLIASTAFFATNGGRFFEQNGSTKFGLSFKDGRTVSSHTDQLNRKIRFGSTSANVPNSGYRGLINLI